MKAASAAAVDCVEGAEEGATRGGWSLGMVDAVVAVAELPLPAFLDASVDVFPVRRHKALSVA